MSFIDLNVPHFFIHCILSSTIYKLMIWLIIIDDLTRETGVALLSSMI
jgi:hypothetical protein